MRFKGNTVSFTLFNGTSMATLHVAGAAAFLFTKFPTATVAQIKDKILRSVDKKPSLTGQVLTGGRLNLYKAAAESTVRHHGYRDEQSADLQCRPRRDEQCLVTRFGSGTAARFQITDRLLHAAARVQSGSRIIPGRDAQGVGQRGEVSDDGRHAASC